MTIEYKDNMVDVVESLTDNTHDNYEHNPQQIHEDGPPIVSRN